MYNEFFNLYAMSSDILVLVLCVGKFEDRNNFYAATDRSSIVKIKCNARLIL